MRAAVKGKPAAPHRAGWTLTELLVGLGLLTLLFLLILAAQRAVSQVSARAGAQALQTQAMNDLTGYLGDRARAALRVRVATSGLRLAGRACTAAQPCLLLVLPEDGAAGVTRYLLYAYRADARSLVSALDRREDDWADAHVRALREYRSTAPGTAGSSVPANCAATPATFAAACPALADLDALSTLSRFQPYLVSDDLAPTDGQGMAIVPFDLNPNTRLLTLRFQFWQRVGGRELRLPPGAPATLDVQLRNLP